MLDFPLLREIKIESITRKAEKKKRKEKVYY